MVKNHYATLGVPETASALEIKGAYRALARRFHPDRNPNDSEAERRFKDIAEAYGVLGDEKRRATHDDTRRAGESVIDLFSRHEAGQHLLLTMLPSSRTAKLPGVHAVATKRVPPQLLRKGGTITVSVARPEKEPSDITCTVLPGPVQPRWLRFDEQGFPGQNGGPAGDLWLVLLPQPKARRA